MKIVLTILTGALLLFAAPLNAEVIDAAEIFKNEEVSAASRKRARTHYQRSVTSRQAYRNYPWPDPSLDRSGRPYRPNIYYPCTFDLGYGRFTSCDTFGN